MVPLIQDTEFCSPVTVLFNSVGCCKEKRANGEWCQPTNSGGEGKSGWCDTLVPGEDTEFLGINWYPELFNWFIGKCRSH